MSYKKKANSVMAIVLFPLWLKMRNEKWEGGLGWGLVRDSSLKNLIRILKSLTKDEDSNSMELSSSEWRALWGMAN